MGGDRPTLFEKESGGAAFGITLEEWPVVKEMGSVMVGASFGLGS